MDDLTKVSTLVSNNAAIAVVAIPHIEVPNSQGLMIALDGVSEPGNLGTIIRVLDWYGISHIIASQDCADPYNQKPSAPRWAALAACKSAKWIYLTI